MPLKKIAPKKLKLNVEGEIYQLWNFLLQKIMCGVQKINLPRDLKIQSVILSPVFASFHSNVQSFVSYA
jgi:hypothetical protein